MPVVLVVVSGQFTGEDRLGPQRLDDEDHDQMQEVRGTEAPLASSLFPVPHRR